MIEISQLEAVVAVANAKSFSKGALQLGITQSAISQNIKNLENKLGVKLFTRSGKAVLLTLEGEKLHQMGVLVLEKMQSTLANLEESKNSMRGKVRIGTLTGIGKTWLAQEVLWYAKENPDLELSVRLGHQDDLLLDFEAGKLDLLILPDEDLPAHGEKEFFLEEKATLVIPKSYRGQYLWEDVSIELMEQIPTVLFESNDHLFYKWCRHKFQNIPKKLNTRFSVNSHGHMLQAVFEGLGIAVIPNHVLNRSYFKDKVETLGADFEVPIGKLYLVYHKDSEHLTRIKKTLERLLQNRDTFKI